MIRLLSASRRYTPYHHPASPDDSAGLVPFASVARDDVSVTRWMRSYWDEGDVDYCDVVEGEWVARGPALMAGQTRRSVASIVVRQFSEDSSANEVELGAHA